MQFCLAVNGVSRTTFKGGLLPKGLKLSFRFHILVELSTTFRIARRWMSWRWEHPRVEACFHKELEIHSGALYSNYIFANIFPNPFRFVRKQIEIDFFGSFSMFHGQFKVQNRKNLIPNMIHSGQFYFVLNCECSVRSGKVSSTKVLEIVSGISPTKLL